MEQSVNKSKEITRMLQEWSGGKQEALVRFCRSFMRNCAGKPRATCAANDLTILHFH